MKWNIRILVYYLLNRLQKIKKFEGSTRTRSMLNWWSKDILDPCEDLVVSFSLNSKFYFFFVNKEDTIVFHYEICLLWNFKIL